MEKRNFSKRLIAYLLDCIITSIPVMIIVLFISFAFFKDIIAGGSYPFILICVMFLPYFITFYLINEGSYKDIVMVVLTIILVIIIETIIYTIIEILMNDTTIGKRLFNLKVEKINDEEYTIVSKIIRNFMKSTSKYLFCVPFIVQLFSKKNQTLYDMIIKTTVSDLTGVSPL